MSWVTPTISSTVVTQHRPSRVVWASGLRTSRYVSRSTSRSAYSLMVGLMVSLPLAADSMMAVIWREGGGLAISNSPTASVRVCMYADANHVPSCSQQLLYNEGENRYKAQEQAKQAGQKQQLVKGKLRLEA